MTTYSVTARRSGAWWAIQADVPKASVHTQSRRIDRIEEAARDAIALALDSPPDSFDVDVEIHLSDGIADLIDAVNQLSLLTDELQTLALQLRRHAVLELQDLGYSVRDSGQLLGLSAQRISQLLATDRPVVDSMIPSTEILIALDERLHSTGELLRHVHETAAIA